MNNPFRENDPPAVNKTEIELARVREREETKRKLGVEREKTKQASRASAGFWLARSVAIASLLGVAIVGYAAYAKHVDAQHPDLTNKCVESVEVISWNDSRRECGNGGWFDRTPLGNNNNNVIIHCHCSPMPASSTTGTSTAAPVATAAPIGGGNGGNIVVEQGAKSP